MPHYLLYFNKKLLVLRSLLILFFFTHFSSISQNNEPQPGEKIDFLVSFGIINAGKASMITDSLKHTYNGKDVYKVKVTGNQLDYLISLQGLEMSGGFTSQKIH